MCKDRLEGAGMGSMSSVESEISHKKRPSVIAMVVTLYVVLSKAVV